MRAIENRLAKIERAKAVEEESARRGALKEWVAAGYDEAFITSYLNSEANSYNHPNAAIEPRIPGIFQYYSAAEDELSKIWAGGSSAQEGADKIAAAWEKITDGIGRDKQVELYKASLGLQA